MSCNIFSIITSKAFLPSLLGEVFYPQIFWCEIIVIQKILQKNLWKDFSTDLFDNGEYRH